MGNFTLGRYLPLNSVIHKMDPRMKILAMLIMLVSIFINAGWIGYGLIFLVMTGVIMMAKLSWSFIWKAMKPMLFMLCFLLVINALVVKEGFVVFTLFGFSLYSGAVLQTLYIAVRLLLMIMITTCLTATTKPMDMTLGIEELLSPFRKIGVPAHEIAMLISIALRFIPDLIEETQRIMKAQQSRGVDMQEGTLKEKISAILSLIVPLFVSAFQRAEDLANAMEARGYNPGEPRTRYRQLTFAMRDYMLLAGSCCVLAAMIVIAVII
ncbi:MAG: energy-coupling factor transporter transmembrane component T family protein [Bulleidia sp.]